MKKILSLFIVMIAMKSYSQVITQVRTVLFDNQYGNARILVEPTTTDYTATKPNRIVYAILICYTDKGQKKALHQDVTYDFKSKGRAELFVGYSAKKANISINNVLFYRRDLLSKDNYPSKSDCL